MKGIEEITWETFDERTRTWLQVLSSIPEEAVVRELHLDLNTGVVTLMGVGGDRVLGVIGPDGDDNGAEVFTPLRSWSQDLPAAPIPYEPGCVHGIALAVFHSALEVLVGDLPLVWDDMDGLCWITDHTDESLDVNTTDLKEYRDKVREFAAWCWTGDFASDLGAEVLPRPGVYTESTPNMIRFLTGGNGSVEIIPALDGEGLIDVNILDPKGRGLCFHLAYAAPEAREAMDRAALFLKQAAEKNKRKENHVSR